MPAAGDSLYLRGPSAEKRREEPQAPNNVGVVLLAVALLGVLAVLLVAGAPALGKLRQQSRCVSMTAAQSAAACAR